MRRVGSRPLMKPQAGSQQSFYKQCKKDTIILDTLSNSDDDDDAFDFDVHKYDVKEGDGDDDVSFHFDQISKGGDDNYNNDAFTFGSENPGVLDTPPDARELSVCGAGVGVELALTPPPGGAGRAVPFSASKCDTNSSSSASSEIGIKNTNHQLLRHLSGCSGNILTLCSCNNNRSLGRHLLIASGADGSIVVWNSVLHTVVYYLTGHLQPVHALLVTPKYEMPGNYLLSGCNGGKILIWDLDNGMQVRTIGFSDKIKNESESNGVTCLATRRHSDCKKKMMLVIAGYMGGGIHIWDFERNFLMFSLQGHSNVVTALSIIEKNSKRTEKEDDFFIVSCSQDSVIHMYDMQEQKSTMATKMRELYHTKMNSILFFNKKNDIKLKQKSSKSFYHISTESEEGEHSVHEDDEDDHSLLQPIRVLRGHESGVRKCIIRPKQSRRNQGHYLISCSDDCTVRYWDVESETEVRVLRGHTDKVSDICAREVPLSSAALQASGTHQNFMLITASLDKTVVIWDGISGEALRCLLGHRDEVYSLCLVEKEAGMFDIVSGGGDGEVNLWNTDCQQDVSSVLLVDRANTALVTPTKKSIISEQAASMNEFKKITFRDRNLISICRQTRCFSDGDDESCNDDEDEDEDDGTSFTFVSCRYGSNVIKVHEGDCRRNIKTSREFELTDPMSKANDDNDTHDEDVSALRVTALSTIHVHVAGGDGTASAAAGAAASAKYNILAGFSNGDIHVLDSVDGSFIKKLSDGNAADVSHDGRVFHAAVVAICVRDIPAEKEDTSRSRCIHVIAARSNGGVVVWDYEGGEVRSSFRDYDEDVSCLALLEVNFALLDSLKVGGFRYSNASSKQCDFNYGIVTGNSSGVIKIWKYNAFGGGWVQCFEISTAVEAAVEDTHHRGIGISSVRVLWNDLTRLGQDSGVRDLSHFQLVTGYSDGSINMWDIETKTMTMVLEQKRDLDVSFQRTNFDFAVTDLCVTKRIDGYEIICARNNKQIMLWRNIDVNNLPGYGVLRELVKRKHWFSLHVLYLRFGWMLFNAWQSNAETLFTYTLMMLNNRTISALIDNVCTYNNPELRSLSMGDVSDEKYIPSYCWLGVKTRRHGQSVLSACVEKRVYDDIKFTLDAWCNVFNSDNIDLFDELQDSFHFHLAQEDLILVADEYSSLFCDFLMNISSQKSHDWIMGNRVRDKFRKREDNMKMKSFDKWYQKKYLEGIVNKKTQTVDGETEEVAGGTIGSFWDTDHNSQAIEILDVVGSDMLSLVSMYEKVERVTEYNRASTAEGLTPSNCFQTLLARLFHGTRTNLGTTLDRRNARSQVLVEGRFMPLRNTLCENLAFLRACLATQNVEIFDTEVLNLTVDYAWRAYGRRGHTIHFVTFLCFLLFAAIATFNFETLLTNERMFLAVISSYSVAMGLQLILGFCLVYLLYLEFVAIITDATMTNLLEALIFYFADVWNIVDLTSYSFNILGVVIRLLNEKDTNLSKIAFAVSSVLMWLKLLYYLRAFKSTGPLVSMILQILFESRFFLFILCIALFGFAQAFLVMGLYGTVGMALLQVFVMMLGDFSLDFQDTSNESITTCFFVLFMVIVTVVFLNLLIAIMGDSYDRIKEKEIAQWRRQQAKSIIDETLLLTDGKKNQKSRTWFPSSLHILRPLNNFGDADDGAEWQGKIAQLKRIITNSSDEMKKETDKHSYRIDVLGRNISDVDEAAKKLEVKLSQKVEGLSERVNDLLIKMDLILEKIS